MRYSEVQLCLLLSKFNINIMAWISCILPPLFFKRLVWNNARKISIKHHEPNQASSKKRCLLWWCSFLFTKKEGSQNYQVHSSNGWVYFKIITFTIFASRPQENLNIGSSYMPIFCLINPKIIACIVEVIFCVCNGASFVEGRVKRGWDPNSKHLS